MSYCKNCGYNLGDKKTCPKCGAKEFDFAEKFEKFNDTEDTTDCYDPLDISDNRFMALLAYFGILVLIPIFVAPQSPFARYHSNQGLILCIVNTAFGIAYGIFRGVLLDSSILWMPVVVIVGLLELVFVAASILGIINVINGKAKELPIIGRFKILK